MPIPFDCPSCGKTLKAPEETAGKRIRCPHCKDVIVVPEPVYEAEEVAPPAPADEPAESGYGLQQEAPRRTEEENRRPCPVCGELILTNALKCRYCGEVFDPALKRAARKKKGDSDSDLTVAEYAVAILCSGIGCIAGIVWMIQGKPKGMKMFGLSLLCAFIWGVLNAMLQSVMKQP
jgi:DNA-directed RNA polymerase subunit M/transcription elongation factor TFIIS